MARSNIYIIPDNFIEGGKVFNGMFKIRNLIEAIALALIVAAPLFMIPYPNLQIQITVMIGIILPVMLLGIVGINDDSLIEFVVSLIKWQQNKRVILYNGNVRPREVRSADVIEAQEMPKDKLVTAMDNWKEKRKQAKANITYVEGVDFEFDEDSDRSSNYVATEKRLITEKNGDTTSKNKNEKSKKSKKNKNILMIEEQASVENENIIEINNAIEINNSDTIGEDDIDVN